MIGRASMDRLAKRWLPPPVIFQVTRLDCGMACLAMVLRHFGRHESLARIRQAVPGSASDTTIKTLIRGALEFDLAARAVRVSMSQLEKLRLPAILHWNFNHFVVLERVGPKTMVIADPGSGRKIVTREEFSDYFTGIAVELWPTSAFTAARNLLKTSLSDLWTSVSGLKATVGLVVAVSIGVQFLLLLTPLMLSVMVDRVAAYRSSSLLAAIGAATTVAVLVGATGEILRRWLLLSVGNQVNAQISLNFVNHLIRLPYRFFQERRLNDLMSRVESIRAIKDTLVNESVPAIIDGLFSIVTLVVVFLLSPLLAAVMVLSAGVYGFARIVTFPAQRRRLDRALEKSSGERGAIMETVRGVQTVKVLNAEWARLSIWHGANREANDALQKQYELTAVLAGVRSLVASADLVAAVFISMTLVLHDRMSLGVLFAVIALRQQFQDRMFGLIDRSFEFGMIRLHLARIADVTLARPEEQSASAVGSIRVSAGALRIEGLSYRYGPDAPWVLRDLSLKVEAGEFLAICGPSGGGKTTLARLMLGLLEPDSGSIYADDQQLVAGTIAAFRSSVAAVLQDDQLFSGTILENICCFDPEIDVARIVEVSKIAQVHGDILSMPTGYYSRIGDMGSSLSGGQRQRILLARALYQRPKILFLDEGTANLDPEREKAIVASLRRLGITLICIAHRSATLEAADRVLTLDGGALIHAPQNVAHTETNETLYSCESS